MPVYGNCSCGSLDQALANLDSNILINITNDVTLSLLIKVSGIENVTIIGHNAPIVNCTSVGGMHFTFCHNLIIEAITWNGCGTEYINNHDEPGLKLSNSSNILVKNCSFQYSKGQAVLLSDVSGDVNIIYCYFAYHSCYRGHGTLIHYSLTKYHQQLQALSINGCNFKNAKSLVYIESRISKQKSNSNITFSNAKFLNNRGISVFIVSQNIYVVGENFFQNNIAKFASEIYVCNHSNIIFGKNSDTMFTHNSGSYGAIFLKNYCILSKFCDNI